ncbi:caldesmon isoform X2 [Sapajus apella]|uniref:Caldesmon isoform X2 n=1 Tax=Sapajus apella TaxID=9515 RepID=A0A6J3HQE7_SAPAP|nr:caldesmon isoform X2 [Sapajus apella]
MILNVAENLEGKRGRRCDSKQKGTDQRVNTKGEHGSILHRAFQPQITWPVRRPGPRPDRPARPGLCTSLPRSPFPAADMLGGSGSHGRRSLAALSQIAYQRNDDDEEEAARERRRRARQERLRQKQEEESLGQVTDQVEVNAQNSVPNEEAKTTTANTQVEGDDEAAFLERLARREERRQKRLQEALERQKEFDPTITDASLSLPSRRMQNDTAENETAEKEEKSESRQERYEIEESETITKSYQKNDWRDADENKKNDKEKEEEEEEKSKRGSTGENQVEVMVEEKTTESQEETVVMALKNGQVSSEEPQPEEEREQGSDESPRHEKVEEEDRERAEAETVRLEAEERERIKAEQDKKIADERARIEAEEKAAAQERERREEERERMREEEKRAAEERQRVKEEEKRAAEERQRIKEEEKRAAEERQRARAEEEEKAKIEEQKRNKQLEEKKNATQETKIKGEKVKVKIEGKWVNEKKVQEDKLQTAVPKKQGEEKGAKREKFQEDKPTFKKEENKDEKIKKDKEPKEEAKSFLDRKKGFTEVKSQNGEFMTHKLKHTENTFSRPGGRASLDTKEAEGAPQVEAGKRLEELRRRRGETESEEFEKLKQKQQEAALELEELKKKREERRKVLEEEEQRRKQEEADRKLREEEEKRRLKEEIERRRAEAAEKRQKMPEDGLSDDKKPFKCFTPKGSSLKIEERAEFLNKSVQKSGVKSTHQAAVVSKIDSRLEQYTSAIEGTKSAKPTKPAASDLPVPAEGVRNIKSMWEKGNVFSSPAAAAGTPNKETAGLKVGVSSRINEWLTKTPDGNKSPAPKPSDLRPGDVSGKRNLWEKQSVDKVTSPTKV